MVLKHSSTAEIIGSRCEIPILKILDVHDTPGVEAGPTHLEFKSLHKQS